MTRPTCISGTGKEVLPESLSLKWFYPLEPGKNDADAGEQPEIISGYAPWN